MKPTSFSEANTVFAKDQPQYGALPAFKAKDGEVITCWKLSLRERLRLLFTGRVWLCLLTFHQPLQPTFMTTKKSEVFEPAPRPKPATLN